MNRLRLLFTYAAMLLFAGSPPASAQDHSLSYFGSASAGTPIDQKTLMDEPTGLLTTYVSPTLQVNESDMDGIATATSYGIGSFGSLHGYVATTSAPGAIPSPSSEASGEGIVNTSFNDAGTVTSSTLPLGTLIQLQISLGVDDVLTASSTVNESGALLGQADVQSTFAFYGSGNFSDGKGDGFIMYADSSVTGMADPAFQTATLQATVGETFQLTGTLYVKGISSAGFYNNLHDPLSSFAVADASNTANFNIDALTPGVTIATASGLGYSTPAAVPEASTAVSMSLLLMLGLGGLLAARRQKTA